MITVPVFPLRTVLFPGGHLPLQIFEPRYLDMVRECARDKSPFAVCLVLENPEDRGAHTIAAFGCLAGIVDFYTLDNGLLGIVAQGGRRVRLRATRVRDNGLIVADVERLPEAAGPEPGPEHALLTDLLRSLLEQAMDDDPDHAPGIDEVSLRDSAYIGYRLAELLPIELEQRQQLLEIGDHRERLNLISDLVASMHISSA